ncbi:hypothetical protein MM1S1540310_2066 [Mycobacteroides abscessus subsp. bolletii 1S-154-0310]|nr:hypothetical protein MM1S1510930_2508 [Mycobacteroides abscessus subsp. bolletii 1S-151-0930]EIU68673.1 hypothetical protein MM1S1520914_2713 [Mycobacteroides abscessus subsp. bolletii 1S-152-0914]EIU75079.1 hypothetical protein MM1S1530915_2054 [Mycobacteroides abscessus subsp. bolletii 1S-153-0915]EIU81454.1 hypothetical protein MM1S1540310_2066 [Mycobacteroides abscessus subsp. bolletii 1S-154-0310]EIU83196.1 hypothetical protein MM2B0626_2418 [Mycobacteroides abscessus subsp. bolletii 2B
MGTSITVIRTFDKFGVITFTRLVAALNWGNSPEIIVVQ